MPSRFKTHEYWMQQARALAENSLPEDVPVGAIILNASGEVLGQGWNERERRHDPTAHAEMLALREAGDSLKNWRLSDCILYVTLEPCPMCASAILQARLPAIVYGADDPIQGGVGSVLNLASYYPHPFESIGGIQEEACRELLHQFFQRRR